MRVSFFPPKPDAANQPDGSSIWTLRTQYHRLHKSMGLPGPPEPAFRSLREDYSAPGRQYHTLMHVSDGLQQFETLRRQLPPESHDLVRLAIWNHDRVFDPKRTDNERQSACRLADYLENAQDSLQLASEAYRLILSTSHREPPSQPDEKVMADIDLRPLALRRPHFERNTRRLRAEYAQAGLADSKFNADCGAFFKSLLERPSIFSTERYHERYEHRARENMEQALKSL